MADHEDLLHGERLLLRTLRLLALTTPCHGLRGLFEDACGCAGHEAYRTLEVFLQQLGLHGRRRLVLSVPADARLTGDEVIILDVFGCAQADHYVAMDDGLSRLLGAEPPPALGAAICLVAQTFAMSGLFLRMRPRSADVLLMAAE